MPACWRMLHMLSVTTESQLAIPRSVCDPCMRAGSLSSAARLCKGQRLQGPALLVEAVCGGGDGTCQQSASFSWWSVFGRPRLRALQFARPTSQHISRV